MNLRRALEPSAADELSAIDDEVSQTVSTSLEEAQAATQTPATRARMNVYSTQELEKLD